MGAGGLSTGAICGIAIGAFVVFVLVICTCMQSRAKGQWQIPYLQEGSSTDRGGGGGYTGQRHWSSAGKLQFPEPIVPPYKPPKEELLVIHGPVCQCYDCKNKRRNDYP